jgi:hypothetical protein
MKKIVNTWYSEPLAKQLFFTGLVYEMEDGTYWITAQDGFVRPGAFFTKQQLEEIEEKADK